MFWFFILLLVLVVLGTGFGLVLDLAFRCLGDFLLCFVFLFVGGWVLFFPFCLLLHDRGTCHSGGSVAVLVFVLVLVFVSVLVLVFGFVSVLVFLDYLFYSVRACVCFSLCSVLFAVLLVFCIHR